MVTNNAANIPTGASSTVLQGAGVGTAPAFSTATYPATTTSQQLLYSTATNVVGQLTTANSALAATNSSGTLAMRLFSVVTQLFTSTGTYTPTAGMLYCKIECLGGGGAGGGAAATGVATSSCGGGGGGGEYASGIFSAATIGASKAVTIGAAGAANSGAAGGNGGNTSVGATNISANGGVGGTSSGALATSNADGGTGGTGGTGGDFRTPGQTGGTGYGNITAVILTGGYGGSTQYGAGGYCINTGASNQGQPGLGYGAGGGGSSNFTSQGALSGGVGIAGVVIITEYVIA